MNAKYLGGIILASIIAGSAMLPVAAAPVLVTFNTSSIAGTKGKLALDYVVSDPPSGQHVHVVNFLTNSTVAGSPESEGGLVEGNFFLPPFTTIGAALAGVVGSGEIGGSFFFNELILNLIFGTSVTFELHIQDVKSNAAGLPDQFSLFLLNTGNTPLFPTDDPTGANALFIYDITGIAGGVQTAFGPATLRGNALNVVTPGSVAVPSPSSFSLVALALSLLPLSMRQRNSREGAGNVISSRRGRRQGFRERV